MLEVSEFVHKFGVGIIPDAEGIQQVYNLAQKIHATYPMSFHLKPWFSIPHVTLFQWKFRTQEEAVQAMQGVDFSTLSKKQIIQWLTIRALKIVFLDCERSHDLKAAHNAVYDALSPICEGKSADPQNFKWITDGQQRSFDETGYPFSQEEYLPHFTIGHIVTPVTDPAVDTAEKREIEEWLARILEESGIWDTMKFEKVVLYKVGDLGACLEFAYEQNIN